MPLSFFNMPNDQVGPMSLIQPKPARPVFDYSQYLQPIQQHDIPSTLHSLGILDRAEEEARYAQDMDARDRQRQQFALGQALGALGGTAAGSILGGANTEQQMSNLLPGVAAAQAMMQQAGMQDARAYNQHNNNLRTAYDTALRLQQSNDQIAQHNQTVAKDMYEADQRHKDVPVFMGYDEMTAPDGSKKKVAKFGINGQVTHMQPIDLPAPDNHSQRFDDITATSAANNIDDILKERDKAHQPWHDRQAEILTEINRLSHYNDDGKHNTADEYNSKAKQIAQLKAEYSSIDQQIANSNAQYKQRVDQIRAGKHWLGKDEKPPQKINLKGSAGKNWYD